MSYIVHISLQFALVCDNGNNIRRNGQISFAGVALSGLLSGYITDGLVMQVAYTRYVVCLLCNGASFVNMSY